MATSFFYLFIICSWLHGKNGFTEVSKNLIRFKNNYVGHSSQSVLLKCQNFLLLIMLELHNYFDSPTKLFLGSVSV